MCSEVCCSQLGCVGDCTALHWECVFLNDVNIGCLATTVLPTSGFHSLCSYKNEVFQHLLCFLPTDLSSIPFSAHRVISHMMSHSADNTGFSILVPNHFLVLAKPMFMIITFPLGLFAAKYSSVHVKQGLGIHE